MFYPPGHLIYPGKENRRENHGGFVGAAIPGASLEQVEGMSPEEEHPRTQSGLYKGLQGWGQPEAQLGTLGRMGRTGGMSPALSVAGPCPRPWLSPARSDAAKPWQCELRGSSGQLQCQRLLWGGQS